MAEPETDKGNLADWVTDRITRGFLAIALALPYRSRTKFMGLLTRKVISPIAGYGKRAEANLAYIFPEMPPAERKRIALQSTDNAGRTLIENYSTAELAAQTRDLSLSGPGLDAVRQAQIDGQGIIFVTGHFGNYEAPRHALHQAGFEVGGLYRPMANRFFNSHYVRTMERVSGPMFEQGRRGTMGFARHIKSGGMAVLLYDLFDWRGEWIDFLGKPSKTSTSAAEMALKFDALIVPYFGVRTHDGFDIILDAPIPKSDAIAMTAEMNRRLGILVREHPGQWMWFHRRWKKKKND